MNPALIYKIDSALHLNMDAELSDRENEICEQVILGNTQLETSEIFFRSPFTISQTIRNAFTKTGARNIMELGVWYWCKKFNVTMIVSERKRKIIAISLLLFFAIHDLVPFSFDMREVKRIEVREVRRWKEDDNSNNDLLCL
jgi:DNA-binding CsgD family transcriptional regulator